MKWFAQLTRLQQFLVKGIGLLVIWQIVYSMMLEPSGVIDLPLTYLVSEGATTALNWLGVDSYYESYQHKLEPALSGTILYIDGVQSVGIGNACNGLEIMVLFIGFLLIFPGKANTKIWYLLFGLLLIYIANIIRVILLGINYIESPSTFDFNHKYTYKIAVYVIVFILWVIWVEKLSGVKWEKSQNKT